MLGYRFYGRIIKRKLVRPDDSRPTPAHRLKDGVDYFPSRRLVLFGHHFSSIAGAGPILGPVLALSLFGWGVTALWILLGVVFIGAVHDYLSLHISVRHGGRSISDVARDVIGVRARYLFLGFVWLTLVLVIAVFIKVTAASLINQPEIVLPTFGLTPLAMLFGFLVYRKNL